MARVLVTGGTGVLGSALVPRLVERGHEVRVLSRHASSTATVGVNHVVGDVRTGDGLVAATADVDVVVHAATSSRRRARATEVDGTRNTLDAAKECGAHFIYVSIVGVDRHRLGYYRAKLAAEQVVETRGDRWTIQRATQFHNLLDMFLGMRVFPATRNMAFQPVDVGEVSDRLVTLVEGEPGRRVDDFGGPQVLPIREINATRRRITGKRAFLAPLPAVGALADFDAGRHLCPDHKDGRITWETWLQKRHDRT